MVGRTKTELLRFIAGKSGCLKRLDREKAIERAREREKERARERDTVDNHTSPVTDEVLVCYIDLLFSIIFRILSH